MANQPKASKIMMPKVKIGIILCGIILLCSCKDKRYFTISKIKDAAKLATTETTIDKIVVGNEQKKILRFITIGNAHVVVEVQAIVKTGIDLKKITAKDVEVHGRQIILTLPAVEMFSFSMPFEKYKIDSAMIDRSLFTHITASDLEEFYRQAELDIRELLPRMGIIEQTEQNTRQMLEALLKTLGYQEISISFKQGDLIPKVDKNDLR
ncbi:MAG TPA: DUF4230 domain-containing protein [Bacteroidales bacterium]